MTKFFGGKKHAKPKDPVPRELPEIKADYESLRNRSGDLQYQIFALTRDLAQVNEALVSVNYEAAARQKLDEKTKTDVKTEAVSE